MIHFIHGLFGEASIWNSYQELGDFKKHSPDAFLKEEVKPQDTIIAYSLGGRIAMRRAKELSFNFKRLILLSSHPGLAPELRARRREWEDDIIQKMDTLPREEFIKFWNYLEVFSSSQLTRLMSEEEFLHNRNLFTRFRLSEQEDYLPDLIKHSEKVLYIYGAGDSKYQKIANTIKDLGLNVKEVNADHRVYLNADELYPILRAAL